MQTNCQFTEQGYTFTITWEYSRAAGANVYYLVCTAKPGWARINEALESYTSLAAARQWASRFVAEEEARRNPPRYRLVLPASDPAADAACVERRAAALAWYQELQAQAAERPVLDQQHANMDSASRVDRRFYGAAPATDRAQRAGW
jgi:hypothetical protein